MIRRLVPAAVLLLAALAATTAQAQVPLPPHRFFGTLTIGGQPAPAGTVIRAFIGMTECGSATTTAAGRYQIDVPSTAGAAGCASGTVTFRVDDRAAPQTADVRSGGFQELNLTIAGAAPPPPPPQRFNAATLDLSDPRPCIPAAGQRVCDATRAALWNGEEAAWRARGVTDPDAASMRRSSSASKPPIRR